MGLPGVRIVLDRAGEGFQRLAMRAALLLDGAERQPLVERRHLACCLRRLDRPGERDLRLVAAAGLIVKPPQQPESPGVIPVGGKKRAAGFLCLGRTSRRVKFRGLFKRSWHGQDITQGVVGTNGILCAYPNLCEVSRRFWPLTALRP